MEMTEKTALTAFRTAAGRTAKKSAQTVKPSARRGSGCISVIVSNSAAWIALFAAIWTFGFVVIPHANAESEKSNECISYVVKPGDTLLKYASKATPEGGDAYKTVERIKKLNNLSSSRIVSGQKILVPVLCE